ncbi:MAG: response regulator [Alphaproteobacteria bacterium]|nr:response regulator [Alphaproteobacteria bacterium]
MRTGFHVRPTTMTSMVYIVDDDAGVRDSLRLLLETAGIPVQTYDRAATFLDAAPGLAGCVLTDIAMPGMDGFELQTRLKEDAARLSVIVMTGQADIPRAVRAMKAGAIDFLEKPFNETQLLDAVRRGLDRSRLLETAEAASAEAASRIASLTPREREVLDLLVAGLPNKVIAVRLGASPRTIEVHRARVFEKLGAKSLPDLVRLAMTAEG